MNLFRNTVNVVLLIIGITITPIGIFYLWLVRQENAGEILRKAKKFTFICSFILLIVQCVIFFSKFFF